MLVINAENVNDAYAQGLWQLHVRGVESNSRNGKVKRIPGPVATVYRSPWERVLFDTKRDANPFLHLFESLWMLNGNNDIAFLDKYTSNSFERFSDDGKTLNGAYGFRWREYFGGDNLQKCINMLKNNPLDRRVVLPMWDGGDDSYMAGKSKDVPCNTHVYFDFNPQSERLDMLVSCRSNDAIWGAYGANAVHFSVLHEYVAASAGLKQGVYTQMSNNLHVYEQHFHLLGTPPGGKMDPYETEHIVPVQLISVGEKQAAFDEDCEMFVGGLCGQFKTAFFVEVVNPMDIVWSVYKELGANSALDHVEDIGSEDWRLYAQQWLARRFK